MKDSINKMVKDCHEQAKKRGLWDKKQPYMLSLCRVHGEISESMEGHMSGEHDKHLPHRLSSEVELADAMLMILSIAGEYGIDLGGAMAEKHKYNLHREDHRPENIKIFD